MRISKQQLPVTSTLLRLLQLGLEQVGGSNSTCASSVNGDSGIENATVVRREKMHPPRTDAHRLSRANLEESGDLELDAILNELCAFEGQLSLDIANTNSNTNTTNAHSQTGIPKMQAVVQRPTHVRTGSGGKTKIENQEEVTNSIARTDSPDNDSAFSDNVSMLSSESSASSGGSGGGAVSSKDKQKNPVDHSSMVKAEKIKIALEKLKEANVKKLFIKAFSHDGSSKSILVDEKMSIFHVTRVLADKNHVRLDPKWGIVEHLPDLFMERVYEDDEMLVDNLLLWTRDSMNKLFFLERPDKYDFFLRPEKYISGPSSKNSDVEDDTRNTLIEECFTNGHMPEVEGPLYLKSEGKKAWKKYYFILRKSGLYYCPKGKHSKSSRDLVCLAKFDSSQVYQGFNWKKKYKSPTEYGFALKHPHLQTKNSKLIKYLCTDDANSLAQWIMGIRIAKCGQRLYDNYRSLIDDIAQEDIDMLASARSISLASVSGSRSSQATTPSSENSVSVSLDSCLGPSVDDDDDDDTSSDTPVNTLSRAPAWRESVTSSSSSSGCLSERSSTGTPTGEHGFEAEFPQGTIKRKPGNPKLPLTSTTRHLVKDVEETDSRSSTLRRPRKSLTEEVNTLRRRNSSNSKSSLVSVPSLTSDENLPPLDCSLRENLPPPPPELLASTLSLNSLPPPPDESTLQTFPEEMTASLISLPPPPPPSTDTSSPPNDFPSPPRNLPSPPSANTMAPIIAPKPCISIPTNRTTSPPPNTLSYSQPSNLPPPVKTPPATPPKPKLFPLPPPAIAPKPIRKESFDSLIKFRNEDSQQNNIYENNVSSPPVVNKSPKKKKISFVDDVQIVPPSPPTSPSKPPLPLRSEATRLSVPSRLGAPGSTVTPPRAFLSNLQKVMQKKWQVAQKCRDYDKTPHEVLGFRDTMPQSETEKNVGAWIEEHYGSLYENLSPNVHVNIPNNGPTSNEPIYQQKKDVSQKLPQQKEAIAQPIYQLNKEVATPIYQKNEAIAQPIYQQNEAIAQPIYQQNKDIAQPIYQQNKDVVHPIYQQSKDIAQPIYQQNKEVARPIYQQNEAIAQPIYQQNEAIAQPIYQQNEAIAQPIYQRNDSLTQPIYQQNDVITKPSLKKKPPPPPKRSDTTHLSTRQ